MSNETLSNVLNLLGNAARTWLRETVRDAMSDGIAVSDKDRLDGIAHLVRDEVQTEVRELRAHLLTAIANAFDEGRNTDMPSAQDIADHIDIDHIASNIAGEIDINELASRIDMSGADINVDEYTLRNAVEYAMPDADDVASQLDLDLLATRIADRVGGANTQDVGALATAVVTTIARKLAGDDTRV